MATQTNAAAAFQSPKHNDLGVPGPIVIDNIPWVEFDADFGFTQTKLLRVSLRENSYTTLIRWKAGTRIPTHRHFGNVHAFTMKGSWRYLEYDWIATAGSYVMETAETEHTLEVIEDMETLFLVQGAHVSFGPERNIIGYDDAQSVLDGYTYLLSLKGLELPAGIVVD